MYGELGKAVRVQRSRTAGFKAGTRTCQSGGDVEVDHQPVQQRVEAHCPVASVSRVNLQPVATWRQWKSINFRICIAHVVVVHALGYANSELWIFSSQCHKVHALIFVAEEFGNHFRLRHLRRILNVTLRTADSESGLDYNFVHVVRR